jgi:predicted phosphodiesterase
MLSDLHLDERVDLDEMMGMNAYDRPIAERRLERIVNGAVDLARHYVSGVKHEGIVVPLLGDIITGDIHDELARTNEAPVPATIVHWVPLLASALVHLADEFGAVHVPTVDGNHDRTYRQTPKKKRAESSNAWIIYNWLADTLRDDSRITFQIGTSAEQLVKVYGTTFLLSHGDSFRSSGGIGGLYPSMMKWLLRRHAAYGAVQQPWDVALIGHWHQLLWHQDCIVNGSLKGYDEYAKDGGFGFERPQQALFFVTPEHGIVQRLPVFAEKGPTP